MADSKETPNNSDDTDTLPGADIKENPAQDKGENQKTKSSAKSSSTSSESEEWSEEAQERIRVLNKENAKYRIRAKEKEQEAEEAREHLNNLTKKFDELSNKVHTDLNAKLDKKIQEADRRTIHAELKAEAIKSGVHNFEDFKKIVDVSSLKVSEDGEVVGVAELIKSTKETKPYLFDMRSQKNTTFTGKVPVVNAESKMDASKLSKAEYEKQKKALVNQYKT